MLVVEELDSIEFWAPGIDLEAAVTPSADVSAIDACFAEDSLVASGSNTSVSAESASEHPATTGLAVLAGFVISGWRPAAWLLERPVQPNVVRLCGRRMIPIVTPRGQKTSRFRDSAARSKPFPLATGSDLPGQLPGRPCKR